MGRSVAFAFMLAGATAGRPQVGYMGTSILLMRHCPRTPYVCDHHPPAAPDQNFTCQDDFTSTPFPSIKSWGAPQGQCTPNGLKLTADIGGTLREMIHIFERSGARVISDSVKRCVDTAMALGLNISEIEVNQNLFDPLSAHMATCTQPDWDTAVQRQVTSMSGELATLRKQLPALQEIVGQGKAPNLTAIPDAVQGGYFVGGLRVASELLVETFILEKTSAESLAWGRISTKELAQLEPIHNTYFRAMYGDLEIAQRYASGILHFIATVFSQFKGDTEFTVLTGHDTNLMAVQSALGLSWECGEWASNTTSPLAGLMFNVDSELKNVGIEVMCETEGLLTFGSVLMNGKELPIPMADFLDQVKAVVLPSCVSGPSLLSLLV